MLRFKPACVVVACSVVVLTAVSVMSVLATLAVMDTQGSAVSLLILNRAAALLSSWARQIGLLVLTWVGSIGALMWDQAWAFGQTRSLVRTWYPEKSENFCDRSNIVMSITLAPFIVFFLVTPDNSQEALLTGLGWHWVVKGAMQAQRGANLPPPQGQ